MLAFKMRGELNLQVPFENIISLAEMPAKAFKGH